MLSKSFQRRLHTSHGFAELPLSTDPGDLRWPHLYNPVYMPLCFDALSQVIKSTQCLCSTVQSED
jgi:hypothetical protein